jgi:hypothetical protein
LFFLKVNDENRRIRIRIHIKMSWSRNTGATIIQGETSRTEQLRENPSALQRGISSPSKHDIWNFFFSRLMVDRLDLGSADRIEAGLIKVHSIAYRYVSLSEWALLTGLFVSLLCNGQLRAT